MTLIHAPTVCVDDNHHIHIDIPLDPSFSQETEDQTVKAAVYLGDYLQLFSQKQESYGKGNIAGFGELGVLVRASDKVERLKQLIYRARSNRLESIRDSWQDLLGYALIGLIVHSKDWD